MVKVLTKQEKDSCGSYDRNDVFDACTPVPAFMAESTVSVTVEQRCIITFLVNVKVRPAGSLRRLQALYGKQTMPGA
ncbi:hypothetical protein ANAPC5_01370 [Anaplasma phagocytophilum]|nr:hypothetical protein ANAPC5_01370 [Anaplasma phagocytophilum]